MKYTLFVLMITILCVGFFSYGYIEGKGYQATRDKAVRQELLHQLDKLYFGICQDIKDSGDLATYKRDCI